MMGIVTAVQAMDVQEVCSELRAKHAKLNELNDAQSDAANAAISEALARGFSNGFMVGAAEEQSQRISIIVPLLTFRAFVVSLLAPVTSVLIFLSTNNAGIAIVGTTASIVLAFYLSDKFFYQVLPRWLLRLQKTLQELAAKKQKDELPR